MNLNINLVISILALLFSVLSYYISRKAFAASSYPKLKAILELNHKDSLPNYTLINESNSLSANNINLTISIAIPDLYICKVARKKWVVYSKANLSRLKPGEKFLPDNVVGHDLITWLKEREYDFNDQLLNKDEALKRQEMLEKIDLKKSYDLRLDVNYESNIFESKKPKKIRIKKYYKLTAHQNNRASDIRDKFYWQLNEKKYLLRS